MLSAIFLTAGVSKLLSYQETARYMELAGVADWLLPLVIASEILLPVMIMLSWHTRAAAVALGIFTVLTALIFHVDFGDQIQLDMFMKNVTIAGGLFLLSLYGAGMLSIDRMRSN